MKIKKLIHEKITKYYEILRNIIKIQRLINAKLQFYNIKKVLQDDQDFKL